jgi:hypothetical protein
MLRERFFTISAPLLFKFNSPHVRFCLRPSFEPQITRITAPGNERLAAQHFVPEFFIQAFGLGRLVLKRLQIHRPRQRRRPAAGLIPLVAMQHDGIRSAGRIENLTDRHPARAMMTARTSSNGNR